MVFLKFSLMAMLGLAIYYGLSLNKFNAETPGLGFWDTTKLYFKQKVFALIANILIIVALTIILVVDNSGWLVKLLIGGTIKSDLPSQFYILSLAIGFMGQSIFSLLMGAKNSIIVDPLAKDTKEG
jgi:hypothetical protein